MYCNIVLDKNGKKIPDFGKKWGSMSKEDANASFIQTGDGLYIIDVDFKDVSNAPKRIKKFIKKLGDATVETARGFHWYIKSDVPMTNHQNIFNNKEFGVDIRGDGGLVFNAYWGDEDGISYKRVGKPLKDKKFKIFKSLPTSVTEPKQKKAAQERGDVGLASKEDVKRALGRVDIKDYQDRDPWMKIIAAIYHGLGNKGEKLARKWSQGDPENYDEGAFNNIWKQVTEARFGTDISVGTLFDASKSDETLEELFPMDESFVDLDPKKNAETRLKELSNEVTKVEPATGLEYDPKDFPDDLSGYMLNVADQMGLNFSSTVPFTMIMLSQLLGSDVKIRMTDGWVHTPVIWGFNIAEAGSGKSPLIRKLSAPIWDIQRKLKNKYEIDLQKHKLEMMSFNSQLKKKEVAEEDRPQLPKIKMVIMDEFTIESMYDQLDDNPDGVMIWKDELKGMFIQKDTVETLRTKLISAWSGQPITRNTKTQGANVLLNPYVRVGGNVQDEVVKEILKNNKSGMNADGFIVRFQLIAYMKDVKFAWGIPTNDFARDNYMNICEKMYENKTEKELILCNVGGELIETFMAEIYVDTKQGVSKFEKEYLAKLGSLLGSLITILHQLTEKKKATVVAPQTIKNAINITKVARANAIRLFDMERREKVADVKSEEMLSLWLKTKGKEFFKRHDNRVTPKMIVDTLSRKVTTTQVGKFFMERSAHFDVVSQGRGHYITLL